MYVKRDTTGQITLVSAQASGDCAEYVAPDNPELRQFVQVDEDDHHQRLRESDLDFVRVLEDVIGLLIEKDVIRFTDLPKIAQEKFSERQTMRSNVDSVGLLEETDEDEEGLI